MKMAFTTGLVSLAIILVVLNSPGNPAVQAGPGESQCESCHALNLSVNLKNGEELGVKINSELFSKSVHAELDCTGCHATVQGYPHPDIEANSLRKYQVERTEICRTCHQDIFTEMNSGGHMAFWGNTIICTDCHDPHYASTGQIATASQSVPCETCHSEIGQLYRESAHGAAITQGLNDLPYCTDCHGAHSFTAASTRSESLELCMTCHDNKELMEKYDVSTTVVQTYLQDFHGKTAILESGQPADTIDSAICTDCHGVHDIKFTEGTNIIVAEDGTTVCQKCHPDTDEKFTTAWLCHSSPSLDKAPLVFMADWFYRLLIPFIVVGLLIHITFDIRQVLKRKGDNHGNGN